VRDTSERLAVITVTRVTTVSAGLGKIVPTGDAVDGS